MVKRGTAGSLSEDVYRRVRDDLFAGHLRPGERLRPSALGERYDASTTVVREALAVLAGERLVTARSGQGYFVPTIDPADLRDLTLVRCHTEDLALRLAIERGGVEWESQILAAQHQLNRTRRRDDAGETNPEWARNHRAFHATLVSGCGVPTLLDMCRDLGAATIIYGVASGRTPRAHEEARDREHDDIVVAVLDRDADRAAELLTSHFRATAESMLANWPEDTGE